MKDMKHYLGIDLGGTNIKVGVIREDYSIVYKHSIPTHPTRPAADIIASMADLGKTALNAAGLNRNDVDYIGVCVPSSINNNTKRVIFANNLGWRDLDLIPLFRREWDIPVYLANDADCAALAEVRAGVASEYTNAIMLTLGTGVGGGLIFNNQVYSGGDGFGSEPGHIVIKAGGELCSCGARGCFEAYASVTALIRDTKRVMDEYPDSVMHEISRENSSHVGGRTAFEAAEKGDEAGMLVVKDYIGHLATGIASLIIVLRPQAVIIGGGVSNAGEPLFGPLREEVAARVCISGSVGIPPVLRAKLGNDAGIIGAALLGV